MLAKAGVSLGASALHGEGREGLVGRSGRMRSVVPRPALVQVRASAGDWSGRSVGTLSGMLGRVGSFFDRSQQQAQKGADEADMVVYKGKITIMKKLMMLDLMDGGADLQDDASELLGNRVTVQLVSNEVDPSMSNLPAFIEFPNVAFYLSVVTDVCAMSSDLTAEC